MVRRLGQDLLFHIILWRSVVDGITVITKKGFWGKTTCRAILNWVLSLNLQMTTRILMLCIALVIHAVSYCNLILLSTTLRHQDILAKRFKDHFWEQNRTIFRCYKIADFFQTQVKLWKSVFEMLNFQNIEKVISLHIHFKLIVV